VTLDEAFDLVSRDATVRAALRAARAWGLRPSQLLEPRRAAAYVVERDDAGRAVTLTAPPLTVEDQALILAFEAYEQTLCDGCGFPLTESTTPENEGRYRMRGLPVRCHACTGAAQAQRGYEDAPDAQALRFPLELVDH
jgi:hypothetical protein